MYEKKKFVSLPVDLWPCDNNIVIKTNVAIDDTKKKHNKLKTPLLASKVGFKLKIHDPFYVGRKKKKKKKKK